MITRLQKWVESSPAILRFERRTASSNNPSLSLFWVALIKIRVLVEFAVRSVTEDKGPRGWKGQIDELQRSPHPKQAIVLANGPSLKKLTPPVVNALLKTPRPHIFALNNYLFTELSKEFPPDYLVLSDPLEIPGNHSAIFWSKVESQPEVKLVVPASWARMVHELKLKNPIYFFDDRSLESWTKRISPKRPRPYFSLTSLKALAFASFLPYSSIGILGFDHSMHETLTVNKANRLIQGSNHAPGAESASGTDITGNYPFGTSDYFYALARVLRLYYLFAGKSNIYNLDEFSLTDAFPKVDFETFKKLA